MPSAKDSTRDKPDPQPEEGRHEPPGKTAEGWAPPEPGDPRPAADLAALQDPDAPEPATDPREPARTQEDYGNERRPGDGDH